MIIFVFNVFKVAYVTRGYYLDSETGYYYLQSRYYNPQLGRFINADKICDTETGALGTNMFAYCENNPIMFMDFDGCDLTWATVFDILSVCIIIDDLHPEYRFKPNISFIGSISLPRTGEPNSSRTLHNPDGTLKQKRWYGPDGNAIRDRDYSHPGDVPFPHDHTWKDGVRSKEHLPPSPDYNFTLKPLLGVGLAVVCIIGIIIVASDDITGIGFLDDFLFAPFSIGVERGLSLVAA